MSVSTVLDTKDANVDILLKNRSLIRIIYSIKIYPIASIIIIIIAVCLLIEK